MLVLYFGNKLNLSDCKIKTKEKKNEREKVKYVNDEHGFRAFTIYRKGAIEVF